MTQEITNLLKQAIEEEGFSQSEVARQAGLSERTVNKACNHIKVRSTTKRKIIRGLNELIGQTKYSVKDLFPNG